MSHKSVSFSKLKLAIFLNLARRETTKNNAVIPKSVKMPQTKQQVYRRLDVHLCCGVRVAY